MKAPKEDKPTAVAAAPLVDEYISCSRCSGLCEDTHRRRPPENMISLFCCLCEIKLPRGTSGERVDPETGRLEPCATCWARYQRFELYGPDATESWTPEHEIKKNLEIV